jgi:polyisoprenoid-binding protein YceI
MMVTWVRGHFKDVHGDLEFDRKSRRLGHVEAVIETKNLWTGEAARDEHLRSEDFLDVTAHPEIRYRGGDVEVLGPHDFRVTGDLTIRGVTRRVPLSVRYLGEWQTPWWEDGVDKGPKTRAGFVASTKIDRHDFGVSWNEQLLRGGVVVGHEVRITLDAEAILDGT